MKKHNINLSWPARLFEFSQDSTNENFSRGKLGVFYKGETEDHRYFSDKFSEQMAKKLAYTPIVSYYDDEQDDFVGHATEQQILGIVDPCKEPEFLKMEDGNIWCICDTVYYTERPDKVGQLAKKIEGHNQSLELDPNSVEYVINYDNKKHFKNIEFTAGDFVGLSVLGKNQKPAFTGSTFFTCDENFENKMKMLREYCEKSDEKKSQSIGGNKMDFNSFMKLSWGDISCKVSEAISKEYENDAYTYIMHMYDDCAIVGFYYFVESVYRTMRVHYVCNENGEIVLGDVSEVYMTWTDVESKTDSAETGFKEENNVEDAACGDKKKDVEDAVCGDKKKENCSDDVENAACGDKKEKQDTEKCSDIKDDVDDVDDKDDKDDVDDDDDKKRCPSTTETKCSTYENSEAVSSSDVTPQSSVKEFTPTTEIEESECRNEQSQEQSTQEFNLQKENSSSTSFTESERAEFEELKRSKKLAMVNSYKDYFEEEVYNTFVSNIDSFTTDDELELALLREYKNSSKTTNKTMRAFSVVNTIATEDQKSTNELDDLVRRYINK